MPELPDVAGFQRHVDAHALRKRVKKVSVSDDRIVRGVSKSTLARRLKNARIRSTTRHGKVLFLNLDSDSGGAIVMHFGMTGEPRFVPPDEQPPKYTRVLIEFDDGSALAYTSRRMLGHVGFTESIDGYIADHDLGPDALAKNFDRDRLVDTLRNRHASIKSMLMDQSLVAGVGNEYADEVLFQARLHPDTPTDRLDQDDLRGLIRVMRRVMRVSARKGGDVPRLPRGYLQHQRHDGGQCPRGHGKLRQKKVGGRTSWFCPQCQKKP